MTNRSPFQPLKVMVLGKMYPPSRGGMESHVRDLVETLLGEFVFDVVVANRENKTSVEALDGRSNLHRLGRLGTLLSTPLCLGIFTFLRQFKADIYHIHSPNPLFELALLLAPIDAPIIVTHHSDVVRQRLVDPLYQHLYRQLLDRADTIIVSTSEYASASKVLQPYLSKVDVIPMTVRDDLCSKVCLLPSTDRVEAIKSGGPYVLSVGRLVSYKGYEHLIDSMKHHDLPVVIVGNGPRLPNLLARTKALGFEERLTILSDANDGELNALYHHCELFALPSISKNEAFGIVQLEAMMHGKPVIVTNIPGSGTSRVQIHNETGCVIEPNDGRALGKAIQLLHEQPQVRQRMGHKARAHVQANFSNSTTFLNKMGPLYRDTLNAAGQASVDAAQRAASGK